MNVTAVQEGPTQKNRRASARIATRRPPGRPAAADSSCAPAQRTRGRFVLPGTVRRTRSPDRRRAGAAAPIDVLASVTSSEQTTPTVAAPMTTRAPGGGVSMAVIPRLPRCQSVAGSSRRARTRAPAAEGMTDALTTVTAVLTGDHPGRPADEIIRRALRQFALLPLDRRPPPHRRSRARCAGWKQPRCP